MPQPQPFCITPLRADFVRRAREEGLDDLNQPVEHHIAQGGEPCRDVLRRAQSGERLLLASYCPFALAGPYKEYGPVYFLAEASDEPVPYTALPIAPAADYHGKPFVLRAYTADERITDAALVTAETAYAQLADLLGRDEVAFVLTRFVAYGCYGCRIERA